jgi:hypothetical protein
MALELTEPLTEFSTKNLSGDNKRSKAGELTTIFESII